MNRLPSRSQLAALCDADRWCVLATHARQAREEIAGIKTGYIRLEGRVRGSVLQATRRRLRRIYEAADYFDLFVEQPEEPKPRVRVKAVGRPAS